MKALQILITITIFFWYGVLTASGVGPDRIVQLGPFQTGTDCEKVCSRLSSRRGIRWHACWECDGIKQQLEKSDLIFLDPPSKEE